MSVWHGVVAFSDTDASGWIHFTAPLRWAENAEHALIRAVAPEIDVTAFPRKAVSATYLRPLRAGDRFQVEIGLEQIGRSSITYAWHVQTEAGTCVEGKHTVVHLGAEGRPSEIPAALRTALS